LSYTNTQALAALSVSDKRRPAQRRSDFADAQRAGLFPVVQALSITPARASADLDIGKITKYDNNKAFLEAFSLTSPTKDLRTEYRS